MSAKAAILRICADIRGMLDGEDMANPSLAALMTDVREAEDFARSLCPPIDLKTLRSVGLSTRAQVTLDGEPVEGLTVA